MIPTLDLAQPQPMSSERAEPAATTGSGTIDFVSDAPLPEAAFTFLRRPNPAVMATVTANCRPVSVATWYLIEDDGLLMLCMNAD